MKQKDLVLVIVIAVISATISFVASHFLFATPQNRQQQVAVVDPVSTDFSSPNTKYFNNQSIDPAKLIQVSGSDNNNPFGNGASQ